MKTNNDYELLELLKRRWKDFFKTYIDLDNVDNVPEIPKEVIDKFNLEIKKFSTVWLKNDTFVTEIIDSHIRIYWHNKFLEKQENSIPFFELCVHISYIVLIISLIILFLLFMHDNLSDSYKKYRFYDNLRSYKWCDSLEKTNNDNICRIGKHRYILKELDDDEDF